MPSSLAVHAWSRPGYQVEDYRYGPGRGGPDTIEAHAHLAYQLGLTTDVVGEYEYRGGAHAVARGQISVINSGERHRPTGRHRGRSPARYTMVYIEPNWLRDLARDLHAHPTAQPAFTKVAVADRDLVAAFRALTAASDPLGQQEQLIALLTGLVTRYADEHPATRPLPRHHPAISRVRDYVIAHHQRDVSLPDLAQVAGLSQFHLARLFRLQTAMSLHAFLISTRIDRAKHLILSGLRPALAATAVGFYDQSHFSHHFKRLVGITPARYARGERR